MCLYVFSDVFSSQKYELVGYWNATKESGESIMKKYLSALDDQVAIIYNEAMEQDVRPWPNPAGEVIIKQIRLLLMTPLPNKGVFIDNSIWGVVQ